MPTVPRLRRKHPPHHLLWERARLAAGIVGFATGVAPADVLAKARGSAAAATGRHLVMYLLNSAFGAPLAHIALATRRDRSTVTYALRLIEERREDPAYDGWIDALEEALIAAPAPACGYPAVAEVSS